MVEDPEQADKIIEHLSKSFPIADEGWAKTPQGYFDRKAMLLMPSGAVAEIQMWHPEMFKAKEQRGGHDLYAQWQGAPEGPERDKLSEGMRNLYGGVSKSLPSSWDHIK